MVIDKGSYRSYYAAMKAVGIKMLKNHLSRYLQLVRKGTLIYVTDRDEVIAEIRRPSRSPKGYVTPWETYLNQTEQEGLLQRALRHTRDLFSPPTHVGKGPIDVASLLDSTREDRSIP